jgi:hypothetical protein
MKIHCLEEHGLVLSTMPALIPRTAVSTDLDPTPRVSNIEFDRLKKGEGVIVEKRNQGHTVVLIIHTLQASDKEDGKWKAAVERQEDLDEEARIVRERKVRAEQGESHPEFEILTLSDSFPQRLPMRLVLPLLPQALAVRVR